MEHGVPNGRPMLTISTVMSDIGALDVMLQAAPRWSPCRSSGLVLHALIFYILLFISLFTTDNWVPLIELERLKAYTGLSFEFRSSKFIFLID